MRTQGLCGRVNWGKNKVFNVLVCGGLKVPMK